MWEALLWILFILIISIFMGGPVSTTIGFTGIFALVFFLKPSLIGSLGNTMMANVLNADNLVLPMFMMMAEFMSRGGIAKNLFYVLSKWLRKLKGGLAVASVMACTIFAALCGSSPATAATVGRVAIDEMVDRGYREDYAIGTVTGGGTLGIMIPPSIALCMYGILTETNILQLLMAGVLPGIMLSLIMSAMCIIRAYLNPELVGEEKRIRKNAAMEKEAKDALKAAAKETPLYNTNFLQDLIMLLPSVIVIVIIVFCMYSGMATAAECAAFGCAAAVIIVIANGKMTKKVFKDSLFNTVKMASMMLLMLASAYCLADVIGRLGIATQMANAIVNSHINKWLVIALMYVLWYFLGTIMNPTAMITCTIPFVFPALTSLGFDPIWLGVVSTLCVEVGMITPPVGTNLFVIKQTTGRSMECIIKGTLPYVGALTLGLIILTVFPQIVTILPAMMK